MSVTLTCKKLRTPEYTDCSVKHRDGGEYSSLEAVGGPPKPLQFWKRCMTKKKKNLCLRLLMFLIDNLFEGLPFFNA